MKKYSLYIFVFIIMASSIIIPTYVNCVQKNIISQYYAGEKLVVTDIDFRFFITGPFIVTKWNRIYHVSLLNGEKYWWKMNNDGTEEISKSLER